jgi:hypothetical protein
MAFKFISQERLDNELDLYSTKWFDYRQLTPMGATRRYIDCYGAIYRSFFKESVDSRAAQYIKPISLDGIMTGLEKGDARARRAFVGCWHGRQCADYMTMPYETYISLAFKARLDYWQQRHLPQPFHLYSRMVVEKVLARWTELREGKMHLSEDPAYLVQNYAGIQHQDDYHEWLFSEAKHRSNPAAVIAGLVNDDVLPWDKVEARCDADMLELMQRYLH